MGGGVQLVQAHTPAHPHMGGVKMLRSVMSSSQQLLRLVITYTSGHGDVLISSSAFSNLSLILKIYYLKRRNVFGLVFFLHDGFG